MRQPTDTTYKNLEVSLVRDMQQVARALPLVRLIDVAPESRREGQASDHCADDRHETCSGPCDCHCHDTRRDCTRPLPATYQGIRRHPQGKTWHDEDETSSRALQPRASREWLDRFQQMQLELSRLAAHAVALVGEPVESCACGRPILNGDPIKRAQNRPWHRRCYLRHYRGQPLET